MPAHAARSFRPFLIAAVAVGVIGASYAGIASARSSSDESETRLTAAAPLSTPSPSASTVSLLGEGLPGVPPASPGAASPSLSVKPKVTVAPTAKPSASAQKAGAPKRPTQSPKKTKSPKRTSAPSPSKTTRPPASDGGDSSTVSEVIRLVNAERKSAGCGPLEGETRLHRAAQKHSDQQAEKNTMSHQLPGEASMGDRVTAEGYRWGGVAENVAAGHRTPADVMDGWMNSPGHKANILNCGYKDIGVGVTKSGQGTLYWTQNFASPL